MKPYVLNKFASWVEIKLNYVNVQVSYEEGTETYCHPLMYRFLFWVVTVSLVLLAMTPIVLLCACCLGLCAAAVGATAAVGTAASD